MIAQLRRLDTCPLVQDALSQLGDDVVHHLTPTIKQMLNILCRWEICELHLQQLVLQLVNAREIFDCHASFIRSRAAQIIQISQKLSLPRVAGAPKMVPPTHPWLIHPKLGHEKTMRLHSVGSLNEFIELAYRSIARYLGQVLEECRLVFFKDLLQMRGVMLGIPERTRVASRLFRERQDRTKVPHEGRTHANELFCRQGVSFVEDQAEVPLVVSNCFNYPTELIGNVQLRNIEQQQNQVGTVCKPFRDLDEVVTAVGPIFSPSEDTRRINKYHRLQNGNV
mmetsp:Transcript_16689/g.43135  ORF Transcript_16689/g.43135 Transcript_16689/m.43135 type:complete len:281 (+) Transcript_16689:66-908(+)